MKLGSPVTNVLFLNLRSPFNWFYNSGIECKDTATHRGQNDCLWCSSRLWSYSLRTEQSEGHFFLYLSSCPWQPAHWHTGTGAFVYMCVCVHVSIHACMCVFLQKLTSESSWFRCSLHPPTSFPLIQEQAVPVMGNSGSSPESWTLHSTPDTSSLWGLHLRVCKGLSKSLSTFFVLQP